MLLYTLLFGKILQFSIGLPETVVEDIFIVVRIRSNILRSYFNKCKHGAMNGNIFDNGLFKTVLN